MTIIRKTNDETTIYESAYIFNNVQSLFKYDYNEPYIYTSINSRCDVKTTEFGKKHFTPLTIIISTIYHYIFYIIIIKF